MDVATVMSHNGFVDPCLEASSLHLHFEHRHLGFLEPEVTIFG